MVLNSKKAVKELVELWIYAEKIFVNFSGSAFERVFNLHRVKTKRE